MRISAKVDYAIRAMAELAAGSQGEPVRAEDIAQRQDIPAAFLPTILGDLRQAQLVRSTRGRNGGYLLARPADAISLADITRAIEGPLANIRDRSLSDLSYDGPAARLVEVWMAVRTGLRDVLETTTLEALISGQLPPSVTEKAHAYEREERRRHHRRSLQGADPGPARTV